MDNKKEKAIEPCATSSEKEENKNYMSNIYPKSSDGICASLIEKENIILGGNLMLLSVGDLISFKTYCINQQDYYQRRFVPDVKKGDGNWPIQERMYSWWLWWFHMTEYVQFTIDKKVNDLCLPSPSPTGDREPKVGDYLTIGKLYKIDGDDYYVWDRTDGISLIATKEECIPTDEKYIIPNESSQSEIRTGDRDCEELPLDNDQPFNTKTVLEILIWASEHLLHEKNYDGGSVKGIAYEEIERCVARAKELIKRLSAHRDCEELKKEVERLKGLIEHEVKRVEWPENKEDSWQKFKRKNKL